MLEFCRKYCGSTYAIDTALRWKWKGLRVCFYVMLTPSLVLKVG